MVTQSDDRYPLLDAPPLPKDYPAGDNVVQTFQIEMILAHNAMMRGLNSIYRNAPLVKPEDEVAFAGYCLCCVAAIEGHHDTEERLVFPFMQQKLDMTKNIEQHKAFHVGIVAFSDYMNAIQKQTEKYDSNKVRTLVDGFGDALVEHLHAEIPTIAPDKISHFERSELNALMKELEADVQKTPMFEVVPFMFSHIDRNAHNWPPFPTPIFLFIKYIARWRHNSYWKFSPFGFNGDPQTYNP